MSPAFIYYILACLLVALFGYNRKWGFWSYFFASMAMSPLVGAIIVLASEKKSA